MPEGLKLKTVSLGRRPAALQKRQALKEWPLNRARQIWSCQVLRLGLHQAPSRAEVWALQASLMYLVQALLQNLSSRQQA